MAEPLKEHVETGAAGGPAELVRVRDKARWIACLSAPEAVREDLLVLHAFDLELARARDVTSQPLLAEIRLTWWRDTIEEIYDGRVPRAHEIVRPLAEVIERRDLSKAYFDGLITARIADTEEAAPESLAHLLERAEDLGAPLFCLCAKVLGGDGVTEAARHAGLAFGLVGIVRSIPAEIARGRQRLPIDVLSQSRMSPAEALAGRDPAGLQAAASGLLVLARDAMDQARKIGVPRALRPAFYPADLAEGEAHWMETHPGQAYPEHRMIARLALRRLVGGF